ncbi:MAG: four helix bundle protein [Deltaproteobacteria bacterium]|nr:four helix bundle protein [Deltaproteobacteria bacterium]MCB9786479.1 four helix bundle protein [Deltaproteobacteria bacterium]
MVGESGMDAERVAARAAVGLFGLARGLSPSFRGLGDQATRAGASVALNLAEGGGRFGRDRVQHYRIAYGSAREASMALELMVGAGAVPEAAGAEVLELLDRVKAMTWRMIHPRR